LASYDVCINTSITAFWGEETLGRRVIDVCIHQQQLSGEKTLWGEELLMYAYINNSFLGRRNSSDVIVRGVADQPTPPPEVFVFDVFIFCLKCLGGRNGGRKITSKTSHKI
jgi:hypothetical protein